MASAGAAARIRSPITVCWWMNAPLAGLERVRLVQERIGNRDLADVVELGRLYELIDLGLRELEQLGRLGGELGDAVSMPGEQRVPLHQHAQEGIGRLASRRRALAVLLVVHPLICNAQGGRGVAGLVRDPDEAVRDRDLESLAVLAEGGGRSRHGERRVALDRQERAELVAAHPVGARQRPDRALEGGSEPGQQRIAGRVAERVVVALEPVQVEENEYLRAALRLGEILEQPAPIAESGQGVGERLLAAQPNHPEVVEEDENQPQDQRADAGGAERQGERVNPNPVVVDEHGQSGEAEERRRRQELPAFDPRAEPHRRRPRGDGEEHEREQPPQVEQRPERIRVRRDPEEIRSVGEREAGEAGGDQQPLAPRPPAGHRKHADDEREQHHVAERVGEIRRDRQRVPAGRLDDRPEGDRRSDGGDAQSADRTVQPGGVPDVCEA